MTLTQTIKKLEDGDPLKIVALGDSLTYGWMAEKGYLDFLKELLIVTFPRSVLKIINRGIPGDTAAGGLHRVKEHVIEARPDVAFIQFGLNDAFSGYTPEQFQRNIGGIIERIRQESRAEILLITSVALGSEKENRFIEQYYDCLKTAASQDGLALACVHEYWKKRISEGMDFNSLVQADRVHPTVTGYRLMAEAVVEVLRPSPSRD